MDYNEDEVAVAERAVAEYRKTHVRHVGYYANRLQYAHPEPLEVAFARAWRAANGLENSATAGVLYDLLKHTKKDFPALTQSQAAEAATVVQWIGSPEGQQFLVVALDAGGFKLVKKEQG